MYAHKARAVYSAVFATAASLALIATLSPAHASGSGEPVSMEVSYRDLDLSIANDVTRLNQRVRSAANQICDVHGVRDLKMKQQAMQCRKNALAKAGSDVQVAIAEQTGGSRLASLGAAKVIGISKQ